MARVECCSLKVLNQVGGFWGFRANQGGEVELYCLSEYYYYYDDDDYYYHYYYCYYYYYYHYCYYYYYYY